MASPNLARHLLVIEVNLEIQGSQFSVLHEACENLRIYQRTAIRSSDNCDKDAG